MLSVVHLLSLTPERFRILTAAEQTDVRVLRALHDECIEWQHPVVVRSGWDMWCEWKSNLLVFSTGCEGLDSILAGGVMTDEVTELVGASSSGNQPSLAQNVDTLSSKAVLPPASSPHFPAVVSVCRSLRGVWLCVSSVISGKTQICMMLALNVCATTAASVLYIDTSQSFSLERCSEIHRSWPPEEVSELMPTLERIHHQPCHSIHQLLILLNNLQHELQQHRSHFAHSLRVVIIDSIGALLAPVIGGGQQRGHALLTVASHMLHALATQHHIAILVTNHTVARIQHHDHNQHNQPPNTSSGSRSQSALGESWRYVADTRLVLDVIRGAGLRLDEDETDADVVVEDGGRRGGGSVSVVRKFVRVRLSKSVKLATGATCVCEITRKGLEARNPAAVLTVEQ